MHGGVAKDALGAENARGGEGGLRQSRPPHREHAQVRRAGRGRDQPLRRDTDAELDFVRSATAAEFGVKALVCDHWARGGAGCEDLARAVAGLADGGTAEFRPLYPDATSLWEKTRAIAREIYGADDVTADESVRAQFRDLEAAGWRSLPVCVAKTQYSFSDDPTLLGAPSGHRPTVREVRLRAGAGFVVVLMGDIRTMPGLPRVPAAERIGVVGGQIQGLF